MAANTYKGQALTELLILLVFYSVVLTTLIQFSKSQYQRIKGHHQLQPPPVTFNPFKGFYAR